MKEKRIKLSTIIILVVVLLLLIVGTVLVIVYTNKGTEPKGSTGNTTWEEERFNENNWDNTIVGDTSHGIPIPNGFTYTQGDLKTGILVTNENLGISMVWIPYNEAAKEINVDDYFANVDYYEIESDVIKSIEKYGGFYVTLYNELEYTELKEISSERYDELNEYANYNTVLYTINSHVLSKEEIQQIEYYLQNNEVEYTLGTTGISIETYSEIYKEETTQTSKSEEKTIKVATTEPVAPSDEELAEVYMLKTNFYTTEVPIPVGFKYSVDESGLVSIQNAENRNLVYVWVPLTKDELDTTKDELIDLYKNWTNSEGEKLNIEDGTELYKELYWGTETLSDEFVASIEKYGGFYISEAELSYDKDKNYYNKARGMIGWDVSKTKSGGNYFRKSEDYPILRFNDIIDIASKVEEGNPSVVSHLMYGVEYDATVLWIAETNSDFKDSQSNDIITTLIYDSTNVGKYDNSNFPANASALESATFFNGIWGLGGNLAEISQERKNGNEDYIFRGGSYNTTGQATPIASRKFAPNSSSVDAGFRVSLYVNPDAVEVEQSYATFEKDTEEDYKEEVSIEVPEEGVEYNLEAVISPETVRVGDTFTLTIKNIPEGLVCSQGVNETKYKQLGSKVSDGNYIYTLEALEAGEDTFKVYLWTDTEKVEDSKMVYETEFTIKIEEKIEQSGTAEHPDVGDSGNKVNINSLGINIGYSKNSVYVGDTFTITVTCPEGYTVDDYYTEYNASNGKGDIYTLSQTSENNSNVVKYTATAKETGESRLAFIIKDIKTGETIGTIAGQTVEVKKYTIKATSETVTLGNSTTINAYGLPDDYHISFGQSSQTGIKLEMTSFGDTFVKFRAIKAGDIEVHIYIYNGEGKCVDTLKTNITIEAPEVKYYNYIDDSSKSYIGTEKTNNTVHVGDTVMSRFYRPKDFSIRCQTSNSNVIGYVWGTGGGASAGYHTGRFTGKGLGTATWTVTWVRNKVDCATSSRTFTVIN